MNIIPIITPLILLAALGFIIAKKNWLSELQLSGLNKITFSLFIPMFLFYRMATADLNSQLDASLFGSFYLPVLFCFAIGFGINYFWHNNYKQDRAASAVFALGSSYSNNVIVGLPVIMLTIGDKALPIVFLIVTFHSAMLFGLTSALASVKSKMNWFAFIKQTLANPLVFGITTGLVWNVSGFGLANLVSETLLLLGQPAIPLALIALGASIAKYDIRGERRFIALACMIKLIILPIIVYLTSHYLFQLKAIVTQVLVILSACPTGVNAYLIAQMHKLHRKAVASTIVASTMVSVITIPLWMIFLELA